MSSNTFSARQNAKLESNDTSIETAVPNEVAPNISPLALLGLTISSYSIRDFVLFVQAQDFYYIAKHWRR
jgi:hypothetical protein